MDRTGWSSDTGGASLCFKCQVSGYQEAIMVKEDAKLPPGQRLTEAKINAETGLQPLKSHGVVNSHGPQGSEALTEKHCMNSTDMQ